MFIIIFFWHRIRDTHCVIFFLCCRRTLGFNSAPFYFFTLSLSLFLNSKALPTQSLSDGRPTQQKQVFLLLSILPLFSPYSYCFLVFFFNFKEPAGKKKMKFLSTGRGKNLLHFRCVSASWFFPHTLCLLIFCVTCFSFPSPFSAILEGCA